jgi:hypothetical protein
MNVIFRVLVLAVVGLLLTFGVLALLNTPQAEVAAIRKHLTAIPNVRVTYISDLTKQASQCITAYVEVDRKGAIGFNGLSTSSFGHSSRIRLHGIGPYGFRTRELVKGQEGYGYDIDVGVSSPIPAARKLGITSVQSAIAHYDELLAIVAHWPVTTNDWPRHWPAKAGEWSTTSDEEVHFPNLPRGDYYFCLKRESDGDEQMWPPNYPKASK